MDTTNLKELEKAYQLTSQANDMMIKYWLENVLWTWRWWLGLFLTTVPWGIWYMIRKKDSTHRLLFVAFFIMLITSWLDLVGILFGTWFYKEAVIPISPSFIPWDITLLPVSVLVFLQFKTNISPFIKAVIFSGISSFAIQPLFVILGFYVPTHWHHYYSFPIFIIIYILADWISKRRKFENIH